MRARFRVAILLAITLLTAMTRCVAACTIDECKSSAPPCHHDQGHPHRGSSQACHQELQMALAHAGFAASADGIAIACPVADSASSSPSAQRRGEITDSPPGDPPHSSHVLRI